MAMGRTGCIIPECSNIFSLVALTHLRTFNILMKLFLRVFGHFVPDTV